MVTPAASVATSTPSLYNCVCADASPFIQLIVICVDEFAVVDNDDGTPIGPSTAVVIRRPRPNPLADPPPNVVKNGDIVYLTLVCTANILNMGKYSIWYSGREYIAAVFQLLLRYSDLEIMIVLMLFLNGCSIKQV